MAEDTADPHTETSGRPDASELPNVEDLDYNGSNRLFGSGPGDGVLESLVADRDVFGVCWSLALASTSFSAGMLLATKAHIDEGRVAADIWLTQSVSGWLTLFVLSLAVTAVLGGARAIYDAEGEDG